MSEIEELRATVDQLAGRIRALEDQVEIMQLVAQYGPSVDSGQGEATAALVDGGWLLRCRSVLRDAGP